MKNKKLQKIIFALFILFAPRIVAAQSKAESAISQINPIIDSRLEMIEKMNYATVEVQKEISRRIAASKKHKMEIFREFYDDQIAKLDEETLNQDSELILAINNFLAKYPDNEKTPYALFKLAQIHFDASAKKYRNEIIEFYENQDRGSKVGSFPQKDLKPAIDTLKRLADRFPNYEHSDLVLYLLGYAYISNEEGDKAEPVLTKLVTDYPDSKFSEESLLRLGEYYFAKKRFVKAVDFYERVMKYPGEKFYDKALYKLSWSYYLTKKYDNAIASFTKLLDYSPGQKKGDPFLSEFKKDAETYIAFSLFRKKNLNYAFEYLKTKSDEPYSYQIQKKLADIYLDRAIYKEAVFTYRDLLAKFPLNPLNPKSHKSLIISLESAYARTEARKERRIIIDAYSPGSKWRSANKDDLESNNAADELLEYNLYSLAIFYDKRGRVKVNSKDLSEAIDLYEKLIEYFPKSEKSYNAQFYTAEAYLLLDETEKALASLDSVLKNNYYNKYYTEALYSEIVVYERTVELNKSLNKWEADYKDKHDEPLPPLAEKLIAACDQFVKKSPTDKRAPRVVYRSGEILAKLNKTEMAKERFAWMISNRPKNDLSKDSLRQILNINTVNENWEETIKTASAFLEKPFVEDEKLEKEVRQILAVASFKTGQQLGNENKFVESAEYLSQVAKKYPDTEIAQPALVLAFENYKKSPDHLKLKSGLFNLLENHPKNKIASSILLELGQIEDNALNFEQAETYYLEALEKAVDKEDETLALLRLASLYESIEENHKAADYYVRYAKNTADVEIKKEATLKAAINYSAIGKFKEINSKGLNPEELLKKDYSKLAMFRLLQTEARFKSGKRKKLTAELRFAEKTIKKIKNADKNISDLFYSLKIKTIDPEIKRFMAIKLAFPRKKFLSQFEKKALLMDKLEKELMFIIKNANLEIASQAIYYLGSAYEDFGEALLATKLPEALSEEERTQMTGELEKMGNPLIKKARSAYMKNITLSKSRKFSSNWVDKSLVRFATMIESETMLAKLNLKFQYAFKEDLFYYTAKPKAKKIEDAKFNQAVKYYEKGDLEEAEIIYRTLLNDDDLKDMALINMAAIFYRKGNLSKTEAIYADYLDKNPKDQTIRSNLAFILRKTGKINKSLEESKRVLSNKPMDERSYNNAAMVYMMKSRIKTAKMILSRGLNVHNKSVLMLDNLGALYLNENDFQNALNYFAKAKSADSTDTVSGINTAYILLKTQNYEEGLALIKSLWGETTLKGPQLYINLGLAYVSLGKNAEAIEHISTNIEYAGPFLKEAKVLLSKTPKTEELEEGSSE